MKDDKYHLDIVDAVLQVMEVEGDTIIIPIPAFRPDLAHLRYPDYPYQYSMVNYLMDECGYSLEDAMDETYAVRINPYLNSFHWREDI